MNKKDKVKNVQISEALFVNLCKYHLLGFTEVQEDIAKELEDKMDRIKKRTIYTDSKINPDKDARETARQQYVELAGIPKDFQY